MLNGKYFVGANLRGFAEYSGTNDLRFHYG
jgi:hypothetical protein